MGKFGVLRNSWCWASKATITQKIRGRLATFPLFFYCLPRNPSRDWFWKPLHCSIIHFYSPRLNFYCPIVHFQRIRNELLGCWSELLGSKNEPMGCWSQILGSKSQLSGCLSQLLSSKNELMGSWSQILGSKNELMGFRQPDFGLLTKHSPNPFLRKHGCAPSSSCPFFSSVAGYLFYQKPSKAVPRGIGIRRKSASTSLSTSPNPCPRPVCTRPNPPTSPVRG